MRKILIICIFDAYWAQKKSKERKGKKLKFFACKSKFSTIWLVSFDSKSSVALKKQAANENFSNGVAQ